MAVAQKVVVRLTDEQRRTLTGLVRTGTHPVAMLRRAQVLLQADAHVKLKRLYPTMDLQ